jgi:hypothetical protein
MKTPPGRAERGLFDDLGRAGDAEANGLGYTRLQRKEKPRRDPRRGKSMQGIRAESG